MVSKNLLKENPKQEQIVQESSQPMCSLRQAIEVISSLISYSHPIRVFAVKWQLIRNNLEELCSCLSSLENYDSIQNPVLSGMISAILASASDCNDLARRCVDLSYGGKLLMQSDLDAMVAKPGVNACKDDMRFYVRDLLTRMKIGDMEMKRQALLNLYDVVVEDDKYVKIPVEVGDIVNILVSLLDSVEMEIQQEAAKVVSVISGFDSYKSVLIGAGVIGPLIRVLESGSEISKEGAASSLQKLTENSENAWSVSAYGGVTALLKICASVDSRAALICPACGVLRNLVGVDEIKRFVIEEGAVPTIIKLARSKDEAVQIISIEFLQNIASVDESVRQLVVREGGIQALVRVFDPKNRIMLMDYGFMDQLLFFLRNGDVSVQELSLKAAFRLCGKSEETKKAMGDAGFMPELVKFLDAKSFEVREMAAVALSSLVSVPKNRKIFVQEDRNVGFLLQLLDQEEANSGSKKFLISILLSLTGCSSGRKKIASSGYLKNIEKLAEAEVSDAKRLVRKLSMSRFRSILNVIWHS
ncbi:ARM REPEAT SUPERFAMILY PROTEIN [Salix purpurea]|uniref:ARM REPEAT SUPERFAMILY PROTEIN n=1 Tax=Salix purpurea TaxID=77065 RepID=A0A9Q1AG11_SALPP|nr:ARM REPEAT SUPERFAMILY PROTEIN [Salix purpurea]